MPPADTASPQGSASAPPPGGGGIFSLREGACSYDKKSHQHPQKSTQEGRGRLVQNAKIDQI